MISYIIRRLLLIVPTMIGVTAVVFFIMAAAPGGIGAALLSQEGQMRPDQRRAVEEYYKQRYGLDQPKILQYFQWLNRVSPIGRKAADEGWPRKVRVGFKAPDLGESMMRHTSVSGVILDALPATLTLNLLTIPLVYVIAIVIGVYAGRYRGQSFDVASGTTMLGLWSVPTMWTGVLLVGYLANKDYRQWFPTGDMHSTTAILMPFFPGHDTSGQYTHGWLLDSLWHLVLPVICLSIGSFAFLSKLMRSSVLDNLFADYARTARAKGVSENGVLFRHVLRNSLLPLITVAAGLLPSLLGGSVIVESIFSIRGMGKLMIDAIFVKDQELVMAETLIVGLLGTLCILAADLCYVIADPRVSYE